MIRDLKKTESLSSLSLATSHLEFDAIISDREKCQLHTTCAKMSRWRLRYDLETTIREYTQRVKNRNSSAMNLKANLIKAITFDSKQSISAIISQHHLRSSATLKDDTQAHRRFFAVERFSTRIKYECSLSSRIHLFNIYDCCRRFWKFVENVWELEKWKSSKRLYVDDMTSNIRRALIRHLSRHKKRDF
jgi:hypothetical protein